MRRVPWTTAALVLAGCKGCADDEPFTQSLEIISDEPVGVVVGDATGIGNASVPVFATNELGAAVPATLSAQVGGDAATVAVDAFGWGTVDVTVPGRERIEVRGTAGAASGTGSAFGLGAVGLGVDRGLRTTARADFVAAAGQGVVWAIGGDLLWSPGDDGAPVPVLALGEAITAVEPVEVDADGVTDLLVHGETTVVLLRGREGGGLIWGAGFRLAGGETIGAAGVDDVDGDVDADLLVVANADADGHVVFATQTSSWTFEEAEGFDLGYPGYGISAQDYDRSGAAELTLVTGDGLIRRYGVYDGAWVSATSYDISVDIGPGAIMPASRDLTGDGEEDVIVAGPQFDGKAQGYVLSLASGAVLYPLFTSESRPDQIGLDFSEATGDGITDVFVAGGPALTLAAWRATSDPATFYTRDTPLNVSADGVAVLELGGDDTLDAVVIEDVLHELTGATSADVPWSPDPETGQLFDFSLATTPIFTDVEGDGTPDLVAWRDDGGGPSLSVFHGRAPDDDSAETFTAGPATSFVDYGTPVEDAVCGASVFAIADDGGIRTLYAFTIGADWGLDLAWTASTVGDHVVCYVANDEVRAVTVADDGDVAMYDTMGTATPSSPVDDPVWDVAVVDEADLAACATEGCQVLAGDLDGDGADDVVTVDTTGATDVSIVLATGTTLTVPALGEGWVGDADGDGVDDLVLAQAGTVVVWRVIGDALAPPAVRVYARPAADGAAYGDLDLDGSPDLFVFGSEGELVYARSR